MKRRAKAARPWSADYLSSRVLDPDVRREAGALHGRVLDLGCGHRRYESALPPASVYVGYDVDTTGSEPDVCGLAEALPFRAGAFDAVLSTQVLEHVPAPAAMLAEAHRVLTPGGILVLTAPQQWRLHEEPHDFWRFTLKFI
jgi:SAM-dependent methyltransferase